jgi:hypothetical protein
VGASRTLGVRSITHHKFKVGETVDFRPGRMGFPAASRECTIVRLLPVEAGRNLYRIKCAAEAFERVVPEAQLTERM